MADNADLLQQMSDEQKKIAEEAQANMQTTVDPPVTPVNTEVLQGIADEQKTGTAKGTPIKPAAKTAADKKAPPAK